MKKYNGFLLEDALFALFVILVCASLFINGLYTVYFQRNLKIDEKSKRIKKIIKGSNLEKELLDIIEE